MRMLLDEQKKRNSKAADDCGLRYDGIQIISPVNREYPKGSETKWAWSDCFVTKLLHKKYPGLEKSESQQRRYKESWSLIYKYYRGRQTASSIALAMWPTSEDKPKLLKKHTKRIEKQIERLNHMAEAMILDIDDTLEEELIPVRTRGCRDLVKNGQVVTDVISDLRWLVTLADSKIVEQARKALAEKDKERQQLRAVCAAEKALPKAA